VRDEQIGAVFLTVLLVVALLVGAGIVLLIWAAS